jgi:signal transduction histidine kinase
MSWRPRTLRAQLVLLILGALFSAQAVSLWLFVGERGLAVRAALGLEAAGRAANVALLLEEAPEDLHPSILRAADSPLVRFSAGPRPLVDHDHGDGRAVAARVRSLLGDGAHRDVRVELHEVGPRRRDVPRAMARTHREMMGVSLTALEMRLSIALMDGGWLNVATRFHRPPLQWPWAATVSFIMTAAAVLAAAGWFLLTRITEPLGRLAAAADRLGRGEAVASLREAGPEEVRELTATFNRMQDRLTRFISERTQLLAALGHDLRSPLTAMRVRAEMVDDNETRERLIATIEEMQEMVDATLAFARGVAVAEASEPVDLAALLADLRAEMSEARMPIALAAAPSTVAQVRPTALRRALRNLVDNACRYGGGAELRLERVGDEARIIVADRGPGIPEADLERAFDPFVRLETSRSRETGGSGLGLSIARTIAHAHGGEVTLANRPGGGLLATLSLPLSRTFPERPGP